jgi:type I restriction enzyme S subunit
MADEWATLPLGDLTVNFDGRRVPVKESDRKQGPYPYYGASGIVDHVDGYIFDGDYLLIAEDGENLRTRQTPVAFIATGKFWVNNHAHIVRGNERATTRFLHYALAATDISGYLTGSTMPKLTQANMNRIPVVAPPLPEQKRIAHILGTLDDKIDLNRRMNATLEAMSRAIFKSWFVDFDPVRQKAAGKPPVGMDAKTAALFPDSFGDSEIGEVPRGWAIQPVESLCEFVTSGGTPARKTADYWEGGDVSWFKTGELLDGPLLESEEKITQKGLENSSCKLWPQNTVLFALYASPTVGRLGVLTQPATANQAAAALKAKPEYGTSFLVNVLLDARNKLQRIAVGAAQQNINQGILKAHAVVAPPPQLAAMFSQWADQVFSQRTALAGQSATLAALRDTLLPKLLSGELRVPEAEQTIEEATA